MPGDVQVTTMACEACNGHFPVADMRSRDGLIICKGCFAKARAEAPATPADAGGSGHKYRIKGISSCPVWKVPGGTCNICGFTDDKSRFFAGQVAEDLLEKTAKTLASGADPENVLPAGYTDIPLDYVAGATTAADSAELALDVNTADGVQAVSFALKDVPQKNQVFVEFANSLDDRFLCQSQMAMDWAAVKRAPLVLTAVFVVLTVLAAVGGGAAGGARVAAIGLAVGLVLVLVGVLWSALTIKGTPRRPVSMSLTPRA